MTESYFFPEKICQHTGKPYKGRVRLIAWEREEPSKTDWYAVEVKDEDQEQWIGGLSGTAAWLELIQQDIEWAWKNRKPKDNLLVKKK